MVFDGDNNADICQNDSHHLKLSGIQNSSGCDIVATKFTAIGLFTEENWSHPNESIVIVVTKLVDGLQCPVLAFHRDFWLNISIAVFVICLEDESLKLANERACGEFHNFFLLMFSSIMNFLFSFEFDF